MAEIEAAKRAAALEAVKNHFPPDPRFVGIGSGTTIVYVVEAIKHSGVDVSRVGFVPTGYQSKQLIINAGLVPIEFDALPDDAMLDVNFDGADEVDEEMNCIKGGGACLYQEKLVAMRSRQFICVAGKDFSFLAGMMRVCADICRARLSEAPDPAGHQVAHDPDRG
jgi:ribose 5-phosphate isomerase A